MTILAATEASELTDPSPRDPLLRLDALFDPGWTPLAPPDDSGVMAAIGTMHGVPSIAYANDPRQQGGALGMQGCARVVEAIDRAVVDGVPVVGLWHSGGARLGEGVRSLDAVGSVFAAIVRASGRVPQISVILGPSAGGAAYGPALTDLVVMSQGGRVFVTGPDVVRSVTGEDVDMAELGGPDTHCRHSGVAAAKAGTDAASLKMARDLVQLLGAPGTVQVADLAPRPDPGLRLPESPRRAYDVRPMVADLLDDKPVELHAKWSPNIVTSLGRLAGRTVGVIANNPLRLGGCLDAQSAEKAARFVRMCDGFGIPLVVMVDVPGYLPGLGQERDGVVRRGAKLLHAFVEAVVPRVTVVTRKAFGGAYIAMNSRSLGATAVYAWEDAEIAVMGDEAAVGILFRKQLAAAPEEQREQLRTQYIAEHHAATGGVRPAVAAGAVDQVISSADTRRMVAMTLAEAADRRGTHANIPL